MTNNEPRDCFTGLLLSVTLFLGAFLLFQVQPIIGRYLLPWFGGTPEVWTTCMLFFQVFLLGGYAYAHWLFGLTSSKTRTILHISLLVLALLFLPIVPGTMLKPTADSSPILRILLICTVTVGLPYLLLASTSPLIQGWFSQLLPHRNPYRLYALSNTGSLLALASFPFVFEPQLTRAQTARAWSVSFAAFVLCAIACAVKARRVKTPWCQPCEGDRSAEADTEPTETPPVPAARAVKWLWLALPACASVELLAVTNTITLDVAAIPFLWVLPLSIYLVSFIICFEHQRWYKRWLFVPLFMLGIGAVIYVRLAARDELSGLDIRTIIAAYVFMLFGCCMVCHGELYRLRPDARHLTGYYLTIASGGALGGILVAVVAPLIFSTYLELELGILATVLFLLLVPQNVSRAFAIRRRIWVVVLCVIGIISINTIGQQVTDDQTPIDHARNFFGVVTVYEESPSDPAEHKRLMQHGTTFHGLQFLSPEKKDIPTAYYSPTSGIGTVLQNWPKQSGRRIGIIGLGVGTIAAYGHETDLIRFYEINPEVERLAKKYFTFLADSKADVVIDIGDGRLVMENQPPQDYDVLVLDAFSSDVVPTHLLTVEAMKIYLKHLDENGVMAFHISTHNLDLQSIVWKLAEHEGLQTCWISSTEDDSEGAFASDWILLSRTDEFFETEPLRQARYHSPRDTTETPLWTDDHINLLKVLKRNPL